MGVSAIKGRKIPIPAPWATSPSRELTISFPTAQGLINISRSIGMSSHLFFLITFSIPNVILRRDALVAEAKTSELYQAEVNYVRTISL